MTKRLYYTNSYLQSFAAQVIRCSSDRQTITLTQTAFYPTSGGQAHDLGTLNGIPVIDVIDEGHAVTHVLDAPLPAGERVSGEIDWPRRFDHMQQHTGQHLLSAVLESMAGVRTTSVHFGDETSTVDVDCDLLDTGVLEQVEARCNAIITERRPVAVTYEEADKADGELKLRKKPTRTGELRIITIEGADRSACGGTHVCDTGELGMIMLGRTERVKKALRLEFLAGGRVLQRARRDDAIVRELGTLVSAGAGELVTAVQQLVAGSSQLSRQRKALEQEVATLRADALYRDTPASIDGVRHIGPVSMETRESLRALAQALRVRSKVTFVGYCEELLAVVAASSDDSGWDAGTALREAVTAVGGKGGGNRGMAEGGVGGSNELSSATELLCKHGSKAVLET